MNRSNDSAPSAHLTLGEALERTALRLRDRATWLLLRGGLVLGSASAVIAPGCAFEGGSDLGAIEDSLLSSTVKDWAQQRGTRERGMVRYEGTNWRELSDCGFRGGCQTVTVFVQLFVRNVPGVNLDEKRVGASVRRQGATEPTNALGYYVRSDLDGWEEWHVPVRMRTFEGLTFSFNAWYEDGSYTDRGKRVWFDDNAGDLYPVVSDRSGVVQQLPGDTQLTVGPGGVQGRIDARIANFDFEKEVAVVWTTDGWQTTGVFGLGAAGTTNGWYYVEPLFSGQDSPDFERWRIDIDIDGPAETFEYALVYRHGLGDGARRYEFWDNNFFSNYRVSAPVLE